MFHDIDLSRVADEALAATLRFRVPQNGFLSEALFNLVTDIMPVICVDGVPYRHVNGIPEVLAIRRNTGECAGKLCTVGGRIIGGRGIERQSVEQSLRTHFKRDLSVEIELDDTWQRPFFVGQTAPGGTGPFGPEDAKHAVALRYLVHLSGAEDFVFGEGFGGREVAGIEWLTKADLPDASAFGYDHYDTFLAALEILERRGQRI